MCYIPDLLISFGFALQEMGRLAKLLILDASSNELEVVPQELDGCAALSDLHLSSNHLVDLPDSIGASRAPLE